MIRRILHAELSDVRAFAREAKRRAVNAWPRSVCLNVYSDSGSICVGSGPRDFGAGYVLDDAHADNWPDGARLLTIGRVTLAAWGGRTS